MKKLVLIAIAFVTLQVTAQEHKREHRKGEHKERSHKQNDFTPEQMATLQTKKMALMLDLTDAQQRDIQKLNLANAKERQAKMEAHKKMRADNKGDKPSQETRYKMMNERLDKQIAHKKQMKSILSKEQFEKFEKGSKRKHMKQRKQGKHRKQVKQRMKKQRSKRS